MKKIVCIGSGVIDILLKSKDFRVLKSHQIQGGIAICEVYGGKTNVEEMELATGGAGTNVAVGLRRLGMVSAAIVRVGQDNFGEMIVNDLKLEGVEGSMIQRSESDKTATSVVLVALDGGRSIMTYRGVSKEIKSEEIAWEKVGTANWIHLSSLGGNMSMVEDMIAFAGAKSISVSWNPGREEIANKARLTQLAKKVAMLVINRLEAALVTGVDYEDEERLVQTLSELGVKVVMTDGKNGAWWIEKERKFHIDGYKTETVDETGAGDGFCSGLIAGLANNAEAEVAMKMGLANGASVVGKMGAKGGLLRLEELEKWMERKVKVVEIGVR